MYYSRVLASLSAVTFLLSTTLAAPHGNLMTRQDRPNNDTLNTERAEAVKAAFQFAWDGYVEYAFPHDELHPISNSYSDSR